MQCGKKKLCTKLILTLHKQNAFAGSKQNPCTFKKMIIIIIRSFFHFLQVVTPGDQFRRISHGKAKDNLILFQGGWSCGFKKGAFCASGNYPVKKHLLEVKKNGPIVGIGFGTFQDIQRQDRRIIPFLCIIFHSFSWKRQSLFIQKT